jgi:hypothetical protein
MPAAKSFPQQLHWAFQRHTRNSVLPTKAGIQEEQLCMEKEFLVYITAGRPNGTLYVGL